MEKRFMGNYGQFMHSFYIFQLPGLVLSSEMQESINPKRVYGPTGTLSSFTEDKKSNIHDLCYERILYRVKVV